MLHIRIQVKVLKEAHAAATAELESKLRDHEVGITSHAASFCIARSSPDMVAVHSHAHAIPRLIPAGIEHKLGGAA